jgi:hypothetical protein
MQLPALVDVAIGLTLVYLGASLFVTIINEYLAQVLSLRGRTLAKNLFQLINDQGLRDQLAKVPALSGFLGPRGLFGPAGKVSSYVDPQMLAQMLIGTVRNDNPAVSSGGGLVQSIQSLPQSALKDQLLALAHSTTDNVEKYVQEVSKWLDTSLTMLGESYKRWLQVISFGLGLVVAVALNLDTVQITTRLYQDKEAREAMAALAEQVAGPKVQEGMKKCLEKTEPDRKKDETCKPISGLVDAVLKRNQTLGQLPIGWKSWTELQVGLPSFSNTDWLARWAGWFLTALALALGAPFWFDLLSKLVNVRYGMRKPAAPGADGG